MLIAGIIGQQGKVQTANLINSILSSKGKRVSVIDSKSLVELDCRLVKSYLDELEKNHTDLLMLKIDISCIRKEFFNNIHFDIMVYTDKADDLEGEAKSNHEKLMRWVFSLVDEKGLVIVNLDDKNITDILQGINNDVVTYGFNSKASITTSSVGDTAFEDSFICCLQKTITAKNGSIIEPQEYRINVQPNEFDRHSVLAAATFAIVNGIDLNTIRYSGEKLQ